MFEPSKQIITPECPDSTEPTDGSGSRRAEHPFMIQCILLVLFCFVVLYGAKILNSSSDQQQSSQGGLSEVSTVYVPMDSEGDETSRLAPTPTPIQTPDGEMRRQSDTTYQLCSVGTPVAINGKVACLDIEELQDYKVMQSQQALALLDPLVQSLNAGASPEMVLRELVATSCKQATLQNSSFWEHASRLYATVRQEANPDTFVSKWPADFAVAVGKECFKK